MKTMKARVLSLLRQSAYPVLGLCLAGTFTACGGETTNPDVKTLDELKFAKGLTITDNGNGDVRLSWVGTNSEDDFTGYNIYGAKTSTELDSAIKGNLEEGGSLQLLDDEGEPRDVAKAVLQAMSYNGKDFETPAAADEVPEGDDLEFKFFPVYTTAEVYPTCIPDDSIGTGKECSATVADASGHTFVGSTWYDISGLKPGSKYCFLILSTLDAGKTVAMTSSEFMCVTPKVVATDLDVSLVNASAKNHAIDLEATRTACTTEACVVSTAVTTYGNCKADDPDNTGESLCLEIFSGNPGFTGGDYVVVNDLGYYANGFSDANLPKAPALPTYLKGAIAYDAGYAPSGQTLPILANHMYVIAHRSGTEETPSSFFYDWYYAKTVTKAANGTDADVTFEIRISKSAGIE